jgi:phthalate 4,5-dioxygenase reductase subunit
MPTHADTQMPLIVARAWDVADGIRSFELVQADGSELPPFTPGSHVKVQAPNGALRKYSLCNDPADRQRYAIAVKRDNAGQGGSVSMHEQVLYEGDTLPTLPFRTTPFRWWTTPVATCSSPAASASRRSSR